MQSTTQPTAGRDGARMFAAAAACGVIGAELLIGSVIAAGRKHPLALGLLGLGFAGAAVGLGRVALSAMPDVLARTRRRIADDVSQIESSVEEVQP